MTALGRLAAVLVLLAAAVVAYVCRNDHSFLHVFLLALAGFAIAIGLAVEIDRVARRVRRRRAIRRHPLLTGGTR